MTGKDINLELAASNAQSRESWRDLARSIETETDPAKVIDLARQLVAKLDEEDFGAKS